MPTAIRTDGHCGLGSDKTRAATFVQGHLEGVQRHIRVGVTLFHELRQLSITLTQMCHQQALILGSRILQ